MTEAQLDGLELWMEESGFLCPVILNKNYVIADGEQRYTIFKRRNEPEIPAIVMPMEKVSQRMIRYIMNTLGGSSDPLRQAYEFEQILKSQRLEDLAQYVADKQETFLKQIQAARDMVNMEKDEQRNLNLDDDRTMELRLKFADIDKYEIIVKHLKQINSESLEQALYDLVKKDLDN